MTRFVTQTFRHLIKRAEVLVLLSHIEIASAAERIQPAERAAVERREAEAVHQRHIRFCRAGDNAFFEAAHHFVDHRDHHPGDDLVVSEVAFRLTDVGQQAIHRRIFFFFGLPLLSSL